MKSMLIARVSVALSVLAVFCAATLTAGAGAETTPEPADAPAFPADEITVTFDPDREINGRFNGSPARIELDGMTPGLVIEPTDPDRGARLAAKITNQTPSTLNLRVEPVDVGTDDSDGSFIALLEGARYGAAAWMSPADTKITLKPGEQAFIPITVAVPEDASPGSMYAGLKVSENTGIAQGEGATAGTRQSLLLQYLFTVPGDLIYDGRITSVEQPRLVQHSSGRFATINYGYENNGNVTDEVEGRIRFESFFGNSVSDIPVVETLVMRDSERSFRAVWTKPPWIGRFTPVIELKARGGRTVTRELEPIWVYPPWIFIIAVLLAITLPVAWNVRNRRRWNRAMDMVADAEARAAGADDHDADDDDLFADDDADVDDDGNYRT